MKTPLCAIGACVAVVGLSWVSAQDAPRPQVPESPLPAKKAATDQAAVPAEPQPSGDLLALRELVKAFTAAYNAGDAPALAPCSPKMPRSRATMARPLKDGRRSRSATKTRSPMTPAW